MKQKRKSSKTQKQSGEDVVWNLEAKMYLEAIRKAKQRDRQCYIL